MMRPKGKFIVLNLQSDTNILLLASLFGIVFQICLIANCSPIDANSHVNSHKKLSNHHSSHDKNQSLISTPSTVERIEPISSRPDTNQNNVKNHNKSQNKMSNLDKIDGSILANSNNTIDEDKIIVTVTLTKSDVDQSSEKSYHQPLVSILKNLSAIVGQEMPSLGGQYATLTISTITSPPDAVSQADRHDSVKKKPAPRQRQHLPSNKTTISHEGTTSPSTIDITTPRRLDKEDQSNVKNRDSESTGQLLTTRANNIDAPSIDQRISSFLTGRQVEDRDCICVPYYQCDENDQIITDGAGILDPRSLVPLNITVTSDAVNTQSSPAISRRSSNSDNPESSDNRDCGRYHVCCRDPDAKPRQKYKPRCGVRNHVGINRRILAPTGNQESDFGEYAWMAAIIRHEDNVNKFVCGGSLISDQYILTVAHCVEMYTKKAPNNNDNEGENSDRRAAVSEIDKKRQMLKVRLSEWDTQRTDEFLPHEDFNVAEIIIHPEFQTRNLWNDIALLKLDRPVVFRPGIDTICLPKQSLAKNRSSSDDERSCMATGWGKDAYRSGQHSNILKEVQLRIVSKEECEQSLRKTRLGIRFKLHKTFLCGGGEPASDTCTGDGGGPLVCSRASSVKRNDDDLDNFGRYELAGLVSWGVSCGLQGVPGIYVDVGQYLDWIYNNSNINSSNNNNNDQDEINNSDTNDGLSTMSSVLSDEQQLSKGEQQQLLQQQQQQQQSQLTGPTNVSPYSKGQQHYQQKANVSVSQH